MFVASVDIQKEVKCPNCGASMKKYMLAMHETTCEKTS